MRDFVLILPFGASLGKKKKALGEIVHCPSIVSQDMDLIPGEKNHTEVSSSFSRSDTVFSGMYLQPIKSNLAPLISLLSMLFSVTSGGSYVTPELGSRSFTSGIFCCCRRF